MLIRTRHAGAFAAIEGHDDLAVPQLAAEITGGLDEGVPYDLAIEVSVVHGRPICTSLTATQVAGGPPVTRRGLNSLPVEKFVWYVAAQSAVTVTSGDGWRAYEPA